MPGWGCRKQQQIANTKFSYPGASLLHSTAPSPRITAPPVRYTGAASLCNGGTATFRQTGPGTPLLKESLAVPFVRGRQRSRDTPPYPRSALLSPQAAGPAAPHPRPGGPALPRQRRPRGTGAFRHGDRRGSAGPGRGAAQRGRGRSRFSCRVRELRRREPGRRGGTATARAAGTKGERGGRAALPASARRVGGRPHTQAPARPPGVHPPPAERSGTGGAQGCALRAGGVAGPARPGLRPPRRVQNLPRWRRPGREAWLRAAQSPAPGAGPDEQLPPPLIPHRAGGFAFCHRGEEPRRRAGARCD